MVPFALVANLVTKWYHLDWFIIWSSGGATCIGSKVGHQVVIVAKKWDPGILDPGPLSGQIRKVEARLGKLAKIRKVETD